MSGKKKNPKKKTKPILMQTVGGEGEERAWITHSLTHQFRSDQEAKAF